MHCCVKPLRTTYNTQINTHTQLWNFRDLRKQVSLSICIHHLRTYRVCHTQFAYCTCVFMINLHAVCKGNWLAPVASYVYVTHCACTSCLRLASSAAVGAKSALPHELWCTGATGCTAAWGVEFVCMLDLGFRCMLEGLRPCCLGLACWS
jgi:hypothetical protein